MQIGFRIRKLRETQGLKQEYVEDQLGISQQALSHIERSDDCSVKKLFKIASVLKVKIEDFLPPPIRYVGV